MFITTGYIDGTWQNNSWASAKGPMSEENVKELYDNCFEIALHGDKHITDTEDFLVSLEKIEKITGDVNHIGFSLPNSETCAEQVEKLRHTCKDKLIYIRGGRRCNMKSMYNRLLYLFYTITKSTVAFKLFNRKNIILNNETKEIFNEIIPTVVVKKGDTVKQLKSLFKWMPDNSSCVLMLHSILDKNDKYYDKDSWCWDAESFEKIVSALSSSEEYDVKCLKALWEENYE
jgi:hypothetical protein